MAQKASQTALSECHSIPARYIAPLDSFNIYLLTPGRLAMPAWGDIFRVRSFFGCASWLHLACRTKESYFLLPIEPVSLMLPQLFIRLLNERLRLRDRAKASRATFLR